MPRPKSRGSNRTPAPKDVPFTHLDKTLFPQVGITKADVLKFYQSIAPRLLPHLRNRPITLERLPDGLGPGAPRFWQKNTPDYYPQWIPRVELPTDQGKPVNYLLVNDEPTLLYLVNQGAMTFHVWLSRVGSLDRPDYVLFDLDRSEATFEDVIRIARHLHRILAKKNVETLVKTSGKSGLHVLAPWREKAGYDAARDWAMQVAGQLVDELPEVATTERLRAQRHGRVYIDVVQNARGHHVVPPYVLRAVADATVSTPLNWKEVNDRLDPSQFTMETVLKRVARQKADPFAAVAF